MCSPVTGRNLVTLILVAMTALGLDACASTTPPAPLEKPNIEARAFAIAPVGNVSPAFVAVRCVSGCPEQVTIWRTDVRAVTDKGASQQALPFENAVAGAGGAVALAPVLTDISDARTIAGILGESFVVGARVGGPGAALTAPAGLAAGAIVSGYLASNPEQLQSVKLRPLALGDTGYQTMGWVFFAKESYRELKVLVRQTDSSQSGGKPVALEEVTLAWNELSQAAAAELRYHVERSNLSQPVELPPLEPVSSKSGGTPVGPIHAIDARTILSVSEIWEVGPELAKQAEVLMANELAGRGYAVEQMPGIAAESRQRAVSVTVLSAVRRSQTVVRVAVEVGVIDSQGRQVFSRTFVGEAPYPVSFQLGSFTISLGTANRIGQALNDALSLAIAKACNDPSFGAAISGGLRNASGINAARP